MTPETIQTMDTPVAGPEITAFSSHESQVAQRVLRRWHEAVPNDRMAHLVKDATRAVLRALQ